MKTQADPSSREPIKIKRGNVTVKIYTVKNRANGVSYDQYTLVYYDGAQRRKQNFGSLEEAKREGALCATKLASREHEVLSLTSTDRSIYLQALEHLRPVHVVGSRGQLHGSGDGVVPFNLVAGRYVHVDERQDLPEPQLKAGRAETHQRSLVRAKVDSLQLG